MADLRKSTGMMDSEEQSGMSMPKGRGGRPKKKTEEDFAMKLAIPESLKEWVDIAKHKHGNNRTEYILSLIRRDIEENREEYEKIRDVLGGN